MAWLHYGMFCFRYSHFLPPSFYNFAFLSECYLKKWKYHGPVLQSLSSPFHILGDSCYFTIWWNDNKIILSLMRGIDGPWLHDLSMFELSKVLFKCSDCLKYHLHWSFNIRIAWSTIYTNNASDIIGIVFLSRSF